MTHADVHGGSITHRQHPCPQRGRRLVRLAPFLAVVAFGLLLGPAGGEPAALQVVACIPTTPVAITNDPRECPGGRVVDSGAALWSVSAPAGGASSAGFQLTKRLDGVSPTLLFDALNQRAFPVALVVFFDDKGGRLFNILLTNVRIASIVTAASDQADGIPVETVSLAFTRLETSFPSSTPLSPRMCWDFTQNRAC